MADVATMNRDELESYAVHLEEKVQRLERDNGIKIPNGCPYCGGTAWAPHEDALEGKCLDCGRRVTDYPV